MKHREKMRHALILVENNSVPSDTRVWAICRSLVRIGWDVSVICPAGRARDTEDACVVENVRIYRFEPSVDGSGVISYMREYCLALLRIRRLVRRLSKHESFDVIHACNPPDFLLLSALGSRRRGAATIFDHHDLSPELYRAKYRARRSVDLVLRFVERLGFLLADVTLASNESFRDVAISRGRKASDDVFVVRNGPNTALFRPTEADPLLRERETHLIGYVGLMASQDGADVAIEALALLRARRSDWRAVFVGDGEALPAIRTLAHDLGLDEFVTFLGYVDDPSRLVEVVASCDVCLSPEPRNELNEKSTFIKVAEYMAVGRPVVAFDLRETRRTAAEAACYAARDDPTAFMEAIDDLLNDDDQRARMGAIGRQRVVDELGWERSEPALFAAYDRAIVRAAARLRDDSRPASPESWQGGS